MNRLQASFLTVLISGVVLAQTLLPEIESWFGPPPENFRIEVNHLRRYLGSDFRENSEWIPLEEWLQDIPVPLIRNPEVLRYYYKCWYELWLNTRPAQGAWIHPVISPSIVTYPEGVRLLDSAIHIFGLCHGGARAIELAKNQVAVLLEYRMGDGRIPREVRVDGPRLLGLGIHPPGLLTEAALEIYRYTGDLYFIQDCFGTLQIGPLQDNANWFLNRSNANPQQLPNWRLADSDWDISHRWDNESRAVVDLASWQCIDRAGLSRMAEILGYEGMARKWLESATRGGESIRNHLWNEEDGYFHDLGIDGKPTGIDSLAGFFPLYARVATEEQAARLVARLKDSDLYRTAFPLPCVSLKTKGYDPDSTWRGNTWPHLNWIVIQGLRNYGYDDEADELSLKTLALIMKHPVSREYYNPLTGEGLGAPHSGRTAALFIRLCNELIARRTQSLVRVTFDEYAATLLPPEEAILSVTVQNLASLEIQDISVKLHSDYPVIEPASGTTRISEGGALGYTFRVPIPEGGRGHTRFTALVTGKVGDQDFHVQENRILHMRPPIYTFLKAAGGNLVREGESKRIDVRIRNFRNHPRRGTIKLTLPEGWEEAEDRPYNFPFSRLMDEAEFQIIPPAVLPDGIYEISTSIQMGRDLLPGGSLILERPTRWAIIGPFDNRGGRGCETSFPPEQTIRLDRGVRGLEGEVRWKLLSENTLKLDRSIDLLGQLPRNEWVTAYLGTVLQSPDHRTGILEVRSLAPLRVWLNKKPVLLDSGSVEITLEPGNNTLLIKTCQGAGDWRIRYYLNNPDGTPMSGVRTIPEALGDNR